MNRRDTLLALLALGTTAGPRVATPQTSPRMPTLGFLTSRGALSETAWDLGGIAIRLKELGWVEGKTIRIERTYAEGKLERLTALAEDLVRKQVDLIYAVGPTAAIAAARATKTIPIVFWGPTFPVEMGLVDSYARPGRNATGVAWSAGTEVYVKLLQFVRELMPVATRVAFFQPWNSASLDYNGYLPKVAQQMVSAAKNKGFELRPYQVVKPEDYAPAFNAMRAWRPQALYTPLTPITYSALKRISDFAGGNRIAEFSDARAFTEAGGLFSYGADASLMTRQAVDQVDRILRGAKPADIPVEMPTRYEMVINRKTAATLGIKIPQSLLVRADEVIG